tara:strand:+ start:365 stop:544 length:180 start_codon:yes stop_codon:yes gene_type:complete
MKFVGYMIETDEEGDIIFDPEMGKQLLKHTPINTGDTFFLSLNDKQELVLVNCAEGWYH